MRVFVVIVTVVGVVFATLVAAVGSFDWFSIGTAIIKLVPYGLYLIVVRALRSRELRTGVRIRTAPVLTGTCLMLSDLVIYLQVFVFPTSSTDAVAVALLPVLQAVVLVPLGILIGFAIDLYLSSATRKKGAAR